MSGNESGDVRTTHVRGPLWHVDGGGGRAHAAHVVRHGRTTWVHVHGAAGGRTHAFEDVEAGGSARRPAGGDGILLAPMTGRVGEVLVQVGDRVEAGQRLVVVSAMKMQIDLKAGIAGVVTKVACREGEQVEGGAELVRVEATTQPAEPAEPPHARRP